MLCPVSVLSPPFRRCVTDRRAFAKNVSKPWDGRANRTRFAEALQMLGSKYVASYGTLAVAIAVLLLLLGFGVFLLLN